MKNKNYAFLGMMIPEEEYETVIKNSKHSMQDAANVLQWHIYNGLCENLNYPIHIINVLPIYSWPQYYKKFCNKEIRFQTQYSSENISIKFCNLKGVRNKSKERYIYKALLNWCDNQKGEPILFVYTLTGSLLKVISKIKKKYSNLRVCSIVADLPNMRNLSYKYTFLKKCFGKITENEVEKYMNCVDYYVLLTKYMADYLDITKPYCVVEGIATSSSEFGIISTKDENIKVILYSGTLHRRFGVWNLVEAFRNIPYDNYRLVLCGIGDCENDIKKAALEDERILFFGQVSRQKVLKLQRNATVVVNPRQNVESFTKYSFPSKNLEYMSSGTPLIAYKLDGIPDEYDEYIFYVSDNSIEMLTNKLIEVCCVSSDELRQWGIKAQQFVLSKKNEIIQTKKIVNLVNKEIHKE